MVDEYEAQETVEARRAHDGHRLECLVQARVPVQGYEQVTAWIETSQADLRSVTAKQPAAACLEASPGDWWRHFLNQRRLSIEE